jgi:hypothetical protein
MAWENSVHPRRSLQWRCLLAKSWSESFGTSLVRTWCTVNDDGYCAALKTLYRMVWFSSTTMPDRTRPSRLGTCYKISVGKRGTVSHTVQIWHQRIFTVFFPWWSTGQAIVSPAMKTSNMLPSWGWTNRDILSTRPRWTNLSHTVTNASHIKGTMLKNRVPVTPSLGIFSFLY